MGNDQSCSDIITKLRISIHVPAWGTTVQCIRDLTDRPFQSTFPRGERHYFHEFSLLLLYFNPRSRVGNDYFQFQYLLHRQNFNPRSRVGNDHSSMLRSFNDIIFQSTFPRGERLDWADISGQQITISIHVPAWGTTIFTN